MKVVAQSGDATLRLPQPVTIYCDSHAGHPLNVARMSVGVTGHWVSTGVVLNSRPRYEEVSDATVLIGADDSPACDEEIVKRTARPRHQFLCPLCGDNLTLRAENLDPVMNRLAQHAVERVSIKALRSVT